MPLRRQLATLQPQYVSTRRCRGLAVTLLLSPPGAHAASATASDAAVTALLDTQVFASLQRQYSSTRMC